MFHIWAKNTHRNRDTGEYRVVTGLCCWDEENSDFNPEDIQWRVLKISCEKLFWS